MPKKYIGLDVLEYERYLIESKILDYEISIFEIPSFDWYTDKEKNQQIDLYKSFIKKEQEKLKNVVDVIDKYASGFNMDASYSSTEPLQEFYNNETERLLKLFKDKLKDYYSGMFNSLMSAGHVSITYFAKTNARQVTLFYGIKSIVTDYLLKQQIGEIERLSNPNKTHIQAIAHKYDFFRDSLVNCFFLINYVENL